MRRCLHQVRSWRHHHMHDILHAERRAVEAPGHGRLPVPAELPRSPGKEMLARVDPVLVVGHDAFGATVIVQLRDPGSGWLHFALDRKSARDVLQAIVNAADAPPPAMRGRA